jgi:hypothetical protein
VGPGHPCPQRPPVLIAALIAAVSSVAPSPDLKPADKLLEEFYTFEALQGTFGAEILYIPIHLVATRSKGRDTLVCNVLVPV